MTRNRKLLYVGLTMLGLIGIGVLKTLEQVPHTRTEPASAEAQRNGFLAAQRTLDQLEQPWQEIRGLSADLPPQGAGVTVIWPADRGALSDARLAAAERFVQTGGHLIVETERWADPLLASFGIHRVREDTKNEDCVDPAAAAANDVTSDPGQTDESPAAPAPEAGVQAPEMLEGDARPFIAPEPPAELDEEAYSDADEDTEEDSELSDCYEDDWAANGESDVYRSGSQLGRPELRIHLHGRSWLISDESPTLYLGPRLRPRVMQRQIGEGRVTALISLDPFRNDELGDHDHAEALHRLIQQPPAQRVLFVRSQPGGLGSWLLEYAWRVLAVGSVLLLLTLWATMPRFGPVAADPQPRRRRLLDHLLASGRLLWSRGEQAVLAAAAADSALQRLRTEYPHVRWLAPAELAIFIQRRFQLDATVVSLMLVPAQVHTPAAMTALARACQRVHRELAPRRAERASNPLYDE